MAGPVAEQIDHHTKAAAFGDPNAPLDGATVWERTVQIQCRKETVLAQRTAAALKAIDSDQDHVDGWKATERSRVMDAYKAELAAIDQKCAEVLADEQEEAKGVLARPLSCLTNEALAGQGRLIELYGRSMSAGQLVDKMRAVLAHGEPASAAAWCEVLVPTLRAMEADATDPMRASAIMAARMEAERLASDWTDAKAPLRPRARQTLADLARVRTIVDLHRLNRISRGQEHPAFSAVPGHSLARLGVF